MRSDRLKRLKRTLDALRREISIPERLDADPVSIVRRFHRPADQEVAGLVVSTLALGRAASARAKAREVLSIMGPHPARFVRRFRIDRDRARFTGWAHRWIRGRDVACLLSLIKQVMAKHGSLEKCFLDGCREEEADLGAALARFVGEIRSGDPEPIYRRGRLPGRWKAILPSPEDGSACKRMNLYLRWMVRDGDGIDLGAWRQVPAAKLVIPLDTHVYRLARHLGLSHRKSPGWQMALDVTRALRRLDPEDPVKYDFLLCHLGMIGRCPWDRDASRCPGCVHWGRCLLPKDRAAEGSPADGREGR